MLRLRLSMTWCSGFDRLSHRSLFTARSRLHAGFCEKSLEISMIRMPPWHGGSGYADDPSLLVAQWMTRHFFAEFVNNPPRTGDPLEIHARCHVVPAAFAACRVFLR